MGARDPDRPKQSERRDKRAAPRQLGCKVELGRGKARQVRNGMAALAPDELRFHTGRSGKQGRDFVLHIRYGEILAVEADGPGGTLTVTTVEHGLIIFHLGKAALEWQARIADRPSRLDELGVTPGARVLLVGVNDDELEAELAGRVRGYEVGAPDAGADDLDLVLAGVEHPADLPRLAQLGGRVRPGGVVWAVFASGARGVDEAAIGAAVAGTGLVPGHSIRLSPTHLALRLLRG